MNHPQVWVKVNAPVDEGIADLIKTLSLFPKLRTFESCERDGDRHAFVAFDYGDDDRELSEFVLRFLGPRLAHKFGDLVWSSVNVTDVGLIQGELMVRRPVIERVARFVRRLHKDFGRHYLP
jgi:hypothetical protein